MFPEGLGSRKHFSLKQDMFLLRDYRTPYLINYANIKLQNTHITLILNSKKKKTTKRKKLLGIDKVNVSCPTEIWDP